MKGFNAMKAISILTFTVLSMTAEATHLHKSTAKLKRGLQDQLTLNKPCLTECKNSMKVKKALKRKRRTAHEENEESNLFQAEFKFLEKWNPLMEKVESNAYRLLKGNILDAITDQLNGDKRYLSSKLLGLRNSPGGIIAKLSFNFKRNEQIPISHLKFLVSRGHISSLKVDKKYLKITKTKVLPKNNSPQMEAQPNNEKAQGYPSEPQTWDQYSSQTNNINRYPGQNENQTTYPPQQTQGQPTTQDQKQTDYQSSTQSQNSPQNSAESQSNQLNPVQSQNQYQAPFSNQPSNDLQQQAAAQPQEGAQNKPEDERFIQNPPQNPAQSQAHQLPVQPQNQYQAPSSNQPFDEPQQQTQPQDKPGDQKLTQNLTATENLSPTESPYQAKTPAETQFQTTTAQSTNQNEDQDLSKQQHQNQFESPDQYRSQTSNLNAAATGDQSVAQSQTQPQTQSSDQYQGQNASQIQDRVYPDTTNQNQPQYETQQPVEPMAKAHIEKSHANKLQNAHIFFKMNQNWYPFLSNHKSVQYKMVSGNIEKGLKSVMAGEHGVKVQNLMKAESGSTKVQLFVNSFNNNGDAVEKLRNVVKSGDIAGIPVNADFFEIKEVN